MDNWQVCNRCIMTNRGDPNIKFNIDGTCNYCTDALNSMPSIYFPNQEGEHKLKELVTRVKNECKEKPYDCLMGVSGGLDSAYLAYLGAKKWGLRILAIHVDDGFDTEIASKNIYKLVNKSGIDLKIIKPDKKQYNELIRAFMLAGVPNLAVPQDNILVAYLFKYAKKYQLPHFFSGGNFALECIIQTGNTHDNLDMKNIIDINKKFGRSDINKLEIFSHKQQYKDYVNKSVVVHYPLNYINYNRENALKELYEYCGFEYYGAKHLENYFTSFLQLYWFPKRFNVDKRTSHLSSMIASGQMTREKALDKIKEPLYSNEWIEKVIYLIKTSFDFSDSDFQKVMTAPIRQHSDYKTEFISKYATKIPFKRLIKKIYCFFLRSGDKAKKNSDKG